MTFMRLRKNRASHNRIDTLNHPWFSRSKATRGPLDGDRTIDVCAVGVGTHDRKIWKINVIDYKRARWLSDTAKLRTMHHSATSARGKHKAHHRPTIITRREAKRPSSQPTTNSRYCK